MKCLDKLIVGIETDTMDRAGMGTAVYTRKMLDHFLQSNTGIEFHAFHSQRVEDPIYKQVHELFLPHVRVPRLSLLLSNMLFYVTNRRRFDIVHYPRAVIYPLFWLPGRKVVVSIHDAGYLIFPYMTDGYDTFAPRARFRPTRFLRDWSGKYGHRWIDAVITPTQFGKEQVVKYYRIPPEKIHVIPYGRDTGFHRKPDRGAVRAEIQRRFGIQGPYVLNVGRIQPHKNVRRLIQAFGEVKRQKKIPHKLVVIGHQLTGTDSVLSLVQELGLSDHIFFPGIVSEQDLISWYNAAEIFVFPSLYEGFGLPPLEAMCCGTPVIASNIAGMPEVVGDAGLLVDPWNVGEIAEAMLRLIDDSKLRESLGQKGLDAAQKFSWHRYAKQVLELYRSLVG